MTTYDYQLIERPKELPLATLGAAGWRVIQTGTDARDGSLAWALMERISEDVQVPPEQSDPLTSTGQRRKRG